MMTNIKKAIDLIDEWLTDNSGYDKNVWSELRHNLLKNANLDDNNKVIICRVSYSTLQLDTSKLGLGPSKSNVVVNKTAYKIFPYDYPLFEVVDWIEQFNNCDKKVTGFEFGEEIE